MMLVMMMVAVVLIMLVIMVVVVMIRLMMMVAVVLIMLVAVVLIMLVIVVVVVMIRMVMMINGGRDDGDILSINARGPDRLFKPDPIQLHAADSISVQLDSILLQFSSPPKTGHNDETSAQCFLS